MTLTAQRPTTAAANIDGFDAAYERLVGARLEYEMLKATGAPFGAIVNARGALHTARSDMAYRRRAVV